MQFDVVILGYYGFGNIGDESILFAMIADLKALMPKIKICVLSNQPEKTSASYGVQAVNRFDLLAVNQCIKHSKLLIAGGGSLLQDATSWKSLWYYLSVIYYAIRHGVKTMIYANGFGPVTGKFNARVTARIISKVDLITVRDAASAIELQKINLARNDIILTADPALGICPSPDEATYKTLKNMGIAAGTQYVGIAMCHKGYCESNLEYCLAQTCDYLNEELHLAPVFLCMQHSVDLQIAKRIIQKMKSKAYVTTQALTISGMLGVISKSSLVIGDRLHALIFAAILGVPPIGIVYDTKVRSFMNRMGNKNIIMSESLTFEDLKQKINNCFRSPLPQESERSIVEMKKLATYNARLATELLR